MLNACDYIREYKTFNPFPDKPLSKLQHNRFITEYKIFAPKTVMFRTV